MTKLFGHMTLNDTDYVFSSQIGQREIYEAVRDYVDRGNAELNQQMGTLVAGTTTDFAFRYDLPAAGYMQVIGEDGRPSAVKAHGYWEVGFPLAIHADQSVGNRTAMAHMTAAALEKHVNTIVADNFNSIRREMLLRLFDNVATVVTEQEAPAGTVTSQPLANGDAVVYPPVIGSMTEATQDHYIVAAALNTANIQTSINHLTHHFGYGSNCITWINTAQAATVRALAEFTPVAVPQVQAGAATAIPINVPAGTPGVVIGWHSAGTWIAIWDFIPANYLLSVVLQGALVDAPAPLMKRVDRVGLATNLGLVFQDEEYPFNASFWEHRFGFGCGNRLNGVVTFISGGGVYVVPAVV